MTVYANLFSIKPDKHFVSKKTKEIKNCFERKMKHVKYTSAKHRFKSLSARSWIRRWMSACWTKICFLLTQCKTTMQKSVQKRTTHKAEIRGHSADSSKACSKLVPFDSNRKELH